MSIAHLSIAHSESLTCPHSFEDRGDKIGDSEQGVHLYGTQVRAEVCKNMGGFGRNGQELCGTQGGEINYNGMFLSYYVT